MALLCFCFMLFGCGEPAEPDYSELIKPPLSGAVSDFLSAEDVAAVTGCKLHHYFSTRYIK